MRLVTWNRHRAATCRTWRPRDAAETRAVLAQRRPAGCIARGLGRSYADSHLVEAGDVLLQTHRDRLLAFDEATGTVECEAGVSFADLIDTFLPRGFFPAVSPGTRHVTVGGAIANDVHGKNHHRDGSFGRHLESLTLLTGTGEVLRCSPDEHADVFRATVGGLGLTGVILTARFRLAATPTAWVKVDYARAADLDAAIERFETTDDRYRYSVAWIDGLARGRSLGRSVVMGANAAAVDDLPARRRAAALVPPRRRRPGIPFNLPAAVLSPLTVRAFNALFYRRHGDRAGALVPVGPFFHPLDAIGHWYRLYGRRGFVQYQVALPRETSRAGLVELLEAIGRSRRASFLAVLKAFGPGGDGLLSFPMAGHTLALDMANTGDDLAPFIRSLDEITLRHGGRVYLAKDAFLDADALPAMYPRLDEFRAVRRRVDPDGVFASSLARRLRLVDGVDPAGEDGS
ncbi:MAG: FAD-binding protein [Planctomycetota bacterium]|jgi:decaprenylphospho-beta-D-ribofuranose 2-oxidase